MASALLIGGAWAALTTLVLGWRIWPAYAETMRAVSAQFGVYGTDPSAMYNLRGTLTLILGNSQGPLINQISTAALLITALIVAWLWHGAWQPDDPRFELRMALTLLFSVLCNPHVHPHDGLVLVAPAVLFYEYLRRQHLPTYSFGAFALLCPALFFIGDFFIGDQLEIQLPVVLMLIFAGWLVWAYRNAPQPQQASSA